MSQGYQTPPPIIRNLNIPPSAPKRLRYLEEEPDIVEESDDEEVAEEVESSSVYTTEEEEEVYEEESSPAVSEEEEEQQQLEESDVSSSPPLTPTSSAATVSTPPSSPSSTVTSDNEVDEFFRGLNSESDDLVEQSGGEAEEEEEEIKANLEESEKSESSEVSSTASTRSSQSVRVKEFLEPELLDVRFEEDAVDTAITQYNRNTFPRRVKWVSEDGTKYNPTQKSGVYDFKLKNKNSSLPEGEVIVQCGKHKVKGIIRSAVLKTGDILRDLDHDMTKGPSSSVVCGVCEVDFHPI
jgi:hypothetical protein